MNPPEPTNAWDMANRLKEPRSESRVRWIRSCVYTPPCKKKNGLPVETGFSVL